VRAVLSTHAPLHRAASSATMTQLTRGCCCRCCIVQAAHREGYKIVVFSNQAGISKNITTAEIVRRRFEKFAAKVSADAAAAAAAAADGTSSSSAASATPLVPMQMLFAPGDGFFRKPFAGMFYLLASKLNDGVPIDVGSSLYVGDAAGRPETAKGAKNRDHSASDMEFAINCGELRAACHAAAHSRFVLRSSMTSAAVCMQGCRLRRQRHSSAATRPLATGRRIRRG